MSWQDSVNGIFEFSGGVFLWANCYRLWKDKQVKGVSVMVSLFWSSWSMWNLYYYPHLGQWASFAGAANIAVPNMVWAIMAMHYSKKVNLAYEN